MNNTLKYAIEICHNNRVCFKGEASASITREIVKRVYGKDFLPSLDAMLENKRSVYRDTDRRIAGSVLSCHVEPIDYFKRARQDYENAVNDYRWGKPTFNDAEYHAYKAANKHGLDPEDWAFDEESWEFCRLNK